MHRGRTDHGGCVASAGPARKTGNAALFAGAILPQLLDPTVLQNVDVIDRQPGLGRDLFNRPTHNTPISSPALPAMMVAQYNENVTLDGRC